MVFVSYMAFSFEFFPARTAESLIKLVQVAKNLSTLEPEYYSVTFGAGGHAQNSTIETITTLQNSGLVIAAHITCIDLKKQQLFELLYHYQQQKINRLVVLRGDLLDGKNNTGDFAHANGLVGYIRQEFGNYFDIQVAAYPEKHIQSLDIKTDIKYFINKVNAGANGAITQYFYQAESYFYFVEQVRKQGINIPIVPGIMPITNYRQLVKFSDISGAKIPLWIQNKLAYYENDQKSLIAFGIDVVADLCKQLQDFGVGDFHFYTMNRTEPTKTLITDYINAK